MTTWLRALSHSGRFPDCRYGSQADATTPPLIVCFGDAHLVTGVPLAQNSALIDVGLDLNLRPTITVGVSYAGQFANDLQDNAVKGRFTWIF